MSIDRALIDPMYMCIRVRVRYARARSSVRMHIYINMHALRPSLPPSLFSPLSSLLSPLSSLSLSVSFCFSLSPRVSFRNDTRSIYRRGTMN